MPYHLPVLLNPLLNAIFNCPSPKTSSLKQMFSRLDDEKFFILVPSTETLLQFQDLESGLELAELCYHYDFVASHIVVIKDPTKDVPDQRSIYNTDFTTLNGRKLSIRYRNSTIVTGDGFTERRKITIKEINLLPTFNDYLKGSNYTPILHISMPLCGDLVPLDELQVFSKVAGNKYSKQEQAPLPFDEEQKKVLYFEQRIQSISDVAERVALTFHLTKARIKKAISVIGIRTEWLNTRDSIRQIISLDKRLNHLEDLDAMIYDYVELKLFTDIQQQLSEIVEDQELEHRFDFKALRSISLNQVPTNFYPKDEKSFSLASVVELEKSVNDALEYLKSIDLKTTHSGKLEVLSTTMRLLSREINGISTDADTLLSLFVLLICRSQVTGLVRTLTYLNNFEISETSIKFGLQGYVLSTFEAALSFFHQDTVDSLTKKCASNKKIWASIQKHSKVEAELLSSNLRIRTDSGESLLSICIQSHNNEVLTTLLANFESEFPLEDILDDRDFALSTLLIQALQVQNSQAAAILSEIILKSCTESEVRSYLNSPNLHNRITAHYIMQDISLLESVGRYFNWEHKDINGHTPLFAVFRSYDAVNYDEIVTKVLDQVVKWYANNNKPFNFKIHEDPKGNTLLHVMKSGIESLLKLPDVNVNKPDSKGLTPLMIYSRYNRITNIETIMKDERLLCDLVQQPLVMTSLDFTKNPKVTKTILDATFNREPVVIHSLRFEERKWKIGIFSEGIFKKYSLDLIQYYLRYLKIMYPCSFHPVQLLTNELRLLGIYGVPGVLRLQSYHTFKKLDMLFSYVNTRGKLWLGKDEEELKVLLDVPTPYLSESERFIKLEPEEINGIQTFLKYNLAEFQKLRNCLIILKKLAIVQQIKHRDVITMRNSFLSLGNQMSQKGVAKSFENTNCAWSYDLSYYEFTRNLEYLEHSVVTLLNNFESLLAKTTLWWKHFGELMELKKEWKKNFPNDKAPPSSANRNFIDTYIEGKRSKFRNELSNQLKMSSLNLKKIGGEIKTTHESIAVGINLFIEFKEQFYHDHIVKSIVDQRIRENKQIMQQLIDTMKGHV